MLGIGGAEHLFPGPSSQLLNRLINGLAEFMAGTEQTDDVSILSLDLSPLQRTLHASNP
jgi:hypothetical protein